MAKINPSFAHDVYRFLIKPLRDADDRGVLEGYVGGIQQAFERTQADQAALLDLFDIDQCPSWALDYLLWVVGWTKSFQHITDSLADLQKRKVIRLSSSLWKQKGTPAGIKNAVRLFTGRDVLYWSWFYMRVEVDQSIIGMKGIGGVDPWLVGQTYGDQDEYLSLVWIMDEDSPDRDLIHELVKLNRPMGEAIRICYAAFVDDFQLGLGKWATIAGDGPVWDDVSYRGLFAAGGEYQLNALGLDALESVTWHTSIRLVGTSVTCGWVFRKADSNNFLSIVLDNDANTLELIQISGGVPTTLDSQALPTMPVDDPVGVVIHSFLETATEIRIQAWVDGVAYIDHVLSPATHPAVGDFVVDLTASTDDLYLDNVLVFEHGMYTDTIEAGDVSRDVEGLPASVSWTDFTPAGWNVWSNWTLTGRWHNTSFRYLSANGAGSLYNGQSEIGYFPWGVAGDYAGVSADDYATSPTVDCSVLSSSTHRIWAEWWQQTRLDYANDTAELQVLIGGLLVKTFTTVETVGGSPLVAWTRYRADITDWAAGEAAVALRAHFNSNITPVATGEGWYIDDVRILAEII